ncbi:MAG: hypothetical protein EOP93_14600 [Lysobacteraceae bacterium]|nr:MAG: hypothetical protein EOP93_14600 [Xanthomonadaceae bacterium]
MANTNDMNRDPISGAPGAHPVGVGLGGTGGAVAGAAIGSLLGPIGTLVGGAIGTVAGAAAGKGAAERMDPTGEAEYWRNEYSTRPYYDKAYSYDDYAPAYTYGDELRASGATSWDASTESRAREGWDKVKSESKLGWDKAKDAVRDAFDRSDRTYRTYEATDRQFSDSYRNTDYYKADHDYQKDYQPAYRYGAQARSNSASAAWDSNTETTLEQGWNSSKGESRLAWNDAKHAVRDAWHGVERALPGDADGDGR